MSTDVPPVSPLVVKSDDGILLFHSLEAASGYLEVPDVEMGVYGPAFDAEGRLLAVELPDPLFEPEPRRWLGRFRRRLLGPEVNPVQVRLVEEEPTHQRQLAELLVSALEKGGFAPTGRDIEDLLRSAVERYGFV